MITSWLHWLLYSYHIFTGKTLPSTFMHLNSSFSSVAIKNKLTFECVARLMFELCLKFIGNHKQWRKFSAMWMRIESSHCRRLACCWFSTCCCCSRCCCCLASLCRMIDCCLRAWPDHRALLIVPSRSAFTSLSLNLITMAPALALRNSISRSSHVFRARCSSYFYTMSGGCVRAAS